MLAKANAEEYVFNIGLYLRINEGEILNYRDPGGTFCFQ